MDELTQQVLGYIVQYGPGIVASVTVLVTGFLQIRGVVRHFNEFKRDTLSGKDAVIKRLDEQNKLLKKQNESQQEMMFAFRAENVELKRSLSELSSRLSHVEFIDK